MTVEAPTAPVLAYEPAQSRSWGPWLFRPSIPSLCLVALAVGCGIWLAKHHLAWVAGPTIDAPRWCVTRAALPDDQHFVAVVPSHGAWVWDTRTGAQLAGWGPDYRTGANATLSTWISPPTQRFNMHYLSLNGRWLGIFAATGTQGVSVYDTADGKLAWTLTLPREVDPVSVCSISPEGSSIVLRQRTAEGQTSTCLWRRTVEGAWQAEAAVGTVELPPYRGTGKPVAMPGSSRVVRADGVRYAAVIDESPSRRPIAVMGTPAASRRRLDSCYVSPSGQVLAVTGAYLGETRIFRKVGGVCRESSFGVLGMPHCWLLLAAMVAAGFSLWRDARKMDSEHAGGTTLISASLILLGLAGTAKVLIDGCLGHWHPSPAPLLVLCGVALATGGRGWRALTLAIAAWLVPLVLYAGVRAAKGGLTGWLTYDLFDRTYFIPRWSPALALGVVGAALAAMVLAMALRLRTRA